MNSSSRALFVLFALSSLPCAQAPATTDAVPVAFESRSGFVPTALDAPALVAQRAGPAAEDIYALPAQALGEVSSLTVADIGAGRGRHLALISERVGPDGALVATEISVSGCEQLRGVVGRAGLENATVFQGTKSDVGLEAESVDVALLSDVYQFVHLLDGQGGQDKHAFLNSLHRALVPGGVVVVTYVTFDHLKREESRAALLESTLADFTDYGFEAGRRWILDGPHWPVLVLEFRSPVAGPAARATHMGREIARTMHWSGADWLLRAEREGEEASARMIAALGVQPGWTVADFGCGNGYHALMLARRVGPTGKVLGVDIQPEMLKLLEARSAEAELDNIEPLLGSALDAPVPPGSCNLVFLADVYHEFSHPVPMLRLIRSALAPGGRVAVLEFRAEDPEVAIKPEHKMTRDQVIAEFAAGGLVLDGEMSELPWQHLLFFRSDEK